MKDTLEFCTDFIGEIESHPELYNWNHADYSKARVLERIWAEIGSKFNEDATDCKNKWRTIRSSFIRSLKANAKCEPGAKKLYYLAKYLQFLKPFTRKDYKDNDATDDINDYVVADSCDTLAHESQRHLSSASTSQENKMRDSLDFCLKFTQEVEKYPALYDSSIPEYNNRRVIDLVWEKIGKHFNETPNDCKNKWRCIRSSYVRSCRLNPKAEAKKEYYMTPYLQFLKPFIKYRSQELDDSCNETNDFGNPDDSESEQESTSDIDIKPSIEEIEVTDTEISIQRILPNLQASSSLNAPKKRTQGTSEDRELDHIDSKKMKVADSSTSGDPLSTLNEHFQGPKINGELKDLDTEKHGCKESPTKNPCELFMLSLVHHMLTMNPQQQLTFQKGIIDLIERIKYPKTENGDIQL